MGFFDHNDSSIADESFLIAGSSKNFEVWEFSFLLSIFCKW